MTFWGAFMRNISLMHVALVKPGKLYISEKVIKFRIQIYKHFKSSLLFVASAKSQLEPSMFTSPNYPPSRYLVLTKQTVLYQSALDRQAIIIFKDACKRIFVRVQRFQQMNL